MKTRLNTRTTVPSKPSLTLLRSVATVALLGLATAGSALAQPATWTPTKTIRVIVPYAPGGGTDVLARLVFAQVGNSLGQPVVVENRPGGNGLIGANYVYEAAPDGSTLLFAAADNISVAPHIFKKNVKFDQNGYTAIAPVAKMGFFLATKAGGDAKTLQDVINKAKNAPADKPITYGHWGAGSMSQMGMELLKEQAQLTSGTQEIPYPGAAPVLNAVLGGHVDYGFIPAPLAIANKSSLTLFGLGSDERFPSINDIPTLKEQGFPVNADTWFGVLAPPGTPKNIVDALQAQIVKAARDPKILARMTDMGYTPFKDDPNNFAKFVKTENARWGEVVKIAKIKVEE